METDGLPTRDISSFYVSSSLRNELRWLPAIAVRFRSFVGAELLETRVFAQWVPERIGLKIAAGCAVGHFE
jgi:hypothetical protein